MRPAERNVEKNHGEGKKPAGMAFVGGCCRIGGRPGFLLWVFVKATNA